MHAKPVHLSHKLCPQGAGAQAGLMPPGCVRGLASRGGWADGSMPLLDAWGEWRGRQCQSSEHTEEMALRDTVDRPGTTNDVAMNRMGDAASTPLALTAESPATAPRPPRMGAGRETRCSFPLPGERERENPSGLGSKSRKRT